MKYLLLLAILTSTLIASSQVSPPTKVPGTKISLYPPKGFVKAVGFDGFQNQSLKASISIVELPAPIDATITGFNAEDLKKKGMVVVSRDTTTHQGMKALSLKIFQSNNGTTYTKKILVFGDSKKTVMINGIYIEPNKQLEEDITAALASVIYDENQLLNKLDAASFTLNTENTDLYFTDYSNGSVIYTAERKVPTDSAVFVASPSNAKITIADKKQFSIERLKKLPRNESILIKETNQIEIDGLKGYEIVAQGKDKNDKTQLIYLVSLFTNDNQYFLLLGTDSTDKNKWLQEFRKVAKTFHKK